MWETGATQRSSEEIRESGDWKDKTSKVLELSCAKEENRTKEKESGTCTPNKDMCGWPLTSSAVPAVLLLLFYPPPSLFAFGLFLSASASSLWNMRCAVVLSSVRRKTNVSSCQLSHCRNNLTSYICWNPGIVTEKRRCLTLFPLATLA